MLTLHRSIAVNRKTAATLVTYGPKVRGESRLGASLKQYWR